MTEQERQGFLLEPRVAALNVATEGEQSSLTTAVCYGYQLSGNPLGKLDLNQLLHSKMDNLQAA